MKVDLSKAKAGDTVKFRCGGEAVIYGIQKQTKDFYRVKMDNEVYGYKRNGQSYVGYAASLDITEVIPAPEVFDWSTVKWGYAYKSPTNNLWAYVGQNPYNKERSVFVAHINGRNVVEWGKDEIRLTRSPEHDIKENV